MCATGENALALMIPLPTHPVRWPISRDARPDRARAPRPNSGSTLRIYNYADYLAPQVIKSFEDNYGVKVSVSTFNDDDEALTKIASGDLRFDIYFPSYDPVSRLVTASCSGRSRTRYIPNIANVWPQFQNPWYDEGWRYSVPYTVYTTGIGWRSRHGQRRHRRLTEPVRRLLGPQVRRATSRSSTTGTPRWAWCCSATESTTSTPPRRPTST